MSGHPSLGPRHQYRLLPAPPPSHSDTKFHQAHLLCAVSLSSVLALPQTPSVTAPWMVGHVSSPLAAGLMSPSSHPSTRCCWWLWPFATSPCLGITWQKLDSHHGLTPEERQGEWLAGSFPSPSFTWLMAWGPGTVSLVPSDLFLSLLLHWLECMGQCSSG